MQRPSVLTRVHVSQGCTLDPQRQWLDRLFACLRQFQLCTLVFISAGGPPSSPVDATATLLYTSWWAQTGGGGMGLPHP